MTTSLKNEKEDAMSENKDIQEATAKRIKHLIYLDEAKLYSLSSQLSEGIVEYVLDEKRTENVGRDHIRKSLSGRTVADILRVIDKTSEKRYLHDRAYLEFEQQLDALNAILKISDNSDISCEILPSTFIQVSSYLYFSDTAHTKGVMSQFIDVMDSFDKIKGMAPPKGKRMLLKSAVFVNKCSKWDLRKKRQNIWQR